MTREIFFALGDDTRLAIVDLLRTGNEMRISDIAESFDLSRQAVTRHLYVLREAGVLVDRHEGRERLFRLEPNGLAPAQSWLSQYDQFWDDKLTELKKMIERRQKNERG